MSAADTAASATTAPARPATGAAARPRPSARRRGRLALLAHDQAADRRGERERDLREEDRAPVERLGQRAAERRADRRAEDGRDRPQASSVHPLGVGGAHAQVAEAGDERARRPDRLHGAERQHRPDRVGGRASAPATANSPKPATPSVRSGTRPRSHAAPGSAAASTSV